MVGPNSVGPLPTLVGIVGAIAGLGTVIVPATKLITDQRAEVPRGFAAMRDVQSRPR